MKQFLKDFWFLDVTDEILKEIEIMGEEKFRGSYSLQEQLAKKYKSSKFQ